MPITGFRTNDGNPYAYLQVDSGPSMALGIDTTASNLLKLSVSATANATPLTAFSIAIDPSANGDITITPHGSGKINLKSSAVVTTGGVIKADITTGAITAIAPSANGQLIIGAATGSFSWATLTAGTGMSITNGASSITLNASATTPLSFPTGSGTATPAANALTIAGGTGINTSGSGSTVTVALQTPVTVANGGTGASTFTANSLLLGNGTSAVSALGVATNGQIPIGSTGSTPVLATITAGSGISVTNGAGSITIAATASAFTWNDVTGTSASMAVNNGYVADNAALVTLTLPSTAAFGSIIEVTGGVSGTGLWKIAQNSGQTIHFGNVNTTTGVGGYLQATAQYDSVRLLCNKANTDWVVLPGTQGNITYV